MRWTGKWTVQFFFFFFASFQRSLFLTPFFCGFLSAVHCKSFRPYIADFHEEQKKKKKRAHTHINNTF